jgi:hypothetical protein
MHVSYESLEKKFPGEGRTRYNEIAKIVGADRIPMSGPTHDGGMDLTGVFDEETRFTPEQQAAVKELFGQKTAKPQETKKDGEK